MLLAQSRPLDSQAATPAVSAAHEAQSGGLTVPLHFEPNLGQTGASVRYLSRGRGYTLFLTPDGAVIKLAEASPARDTTAARDRSRDVRSTDLGRRAHTPAASARRSAAMRLKFEGANPNPELEGLDPMPGRVNYFLGNDPTKWRTSIPTYARVRYREVWPGVDVVYYGRGGAIEYDLIVAAGANPGVIRLGVEGAGAELQRNGDVALKTAIGDLRLCRLRLYQDGPGGARRAVGGRFAILPGRGAAQTIAVQVAGYDRSRPLMIDPQIVYSTYLGGSGGTSPAALSNGDQATAIGLDPLDNVYLTGFAFSTDFPTTIGPTDPGLLNDTQVAFVAKLNPALSGAASLIYSTYLGGSGNTLNQGLDGDQANGIAVDDFGDAFVTGFTFSDNFPITTGALQSKNPHNSASTDAAFVSELDATGALIYSTYLGGSNNTEAERIALPPNCTTCDAYVAGFTDSGDFPVVNGFQTRLAGVNGVGFVAVLNSGGNALTYSTFLGGSGSSGGGYDSAMGIAVDGSGDAYVAGFTSSSNFPATTGAFQTTNHAFAAKEETGFVTKLDPAASGNASMVYSTYLGGRGAAHNPGDACYDITLDSAGDAFVTGVATSPDFPVHNAYQAVNRAAASGGMNAFVTELAPGGSSLLYSTLLGGSGGPFGALGETGSDIAVDSSGDIYVTGTAASTDFPTSPGACQTSNRTTTESFNAFVSELNPAASAAGAQLVFSTYFGGSFSDAGNGIRVDSSGKIYVAGYASSPDMPTTLGSALQVSKKANGKEQADAFLVEMDPTVKCARMILTPQTLKFPNRPVDAPAIARTFSIKNAGKGLLQGNVETLAPPFAVAKSGGFSLNPGQSMTVQVQFAPTMAGTFQPTLQVSSDDPYHQLTPIAVSGTGESGVLSVVPSINFGNVKVGHIKKETLRVKNVGLGTLIGEVAIDYTAPPFSVFSGSGPFTLKAGASKPVVLEFSPTAKGQSFGSVLVTANNTSQQPVPPVGLAGIGK